MSIVNEQTRLFLSPEESAKASGRNRPRPGRPPGKHSNPDYAQVTVYVRKTVRKAIKIRLFEEGLEMSELVERLLSNWLVNQERQR